MDGEAWQQDLICPHAPNEMIDVVLDYIGDREQQGKIPTEICLPKFVKTGIPPDQFTLPTLSGFPMRVSPGYVLAPMGQSRRSQRIWDVFLLKERTRSDFRIRHHWFYVQLGLAGASERNLYSTLRLDGYTPSQALELVKALA